MKTLVTTIAAIVALGILATAGLAADFVLTVAPDGANWVYTLTNNHATIDVRDFELHWYQAEDPDPPTPDLDAATANFDPINGYLTPNPTGWEPMGGDFPSFGSWGPTPNPILHGGHSLTGFKLSYIGATRPTWFSVSYLDDGEYTISSRMAITGEIVPEPASIATFLAGLAGSGLLLRKRNR